MLCKLTSESAAAAVRSASAQWPRSLARSHPQRRLCVCMFRVCSLADVSVFKRERKGRASVDVNQEGERDGGTKRERSRPAGREINELSGIQIHFCTEEAFECFPASMRRQLITIRSSHHDETNVSTEAFPLMATRG